jgi:hypothetical protein
VHPRPGRCRSRLGTPHPKTVSAGAPLPKVPAAETTGATEGTNVLRAALCTALYGDGQPCPIYQNAPAQTVPAKPPAIEAVIAIFPDPIHTHLSLRFDRSIDALIAAAQDAGWYLDRQWLPWAWMAAGEQGDDAGGKDLEKLVQSRTYRRGFENVPGFISFRPIGGRQTHPLVIFVVGDSPISGLLPQQFRAAYALTRRLQQPSGSGPASGNIKELRIIGPSFTGSISSLASLLSMPDKPGADAPFTSIRIISPSISRDLTSVHFNGGEFAQVSPVPVFQSEGMAQNCRIRSVVDFVQRQTSSDDEVPNSSEREIGQSTRIALLSEDESAYGRIAVDTPPPGASGATKPTPGKLGHDPCDLSQSDILHLTFPRDISHLRAAYQKKSIWGFGSGSTGGTSLGLDFSDPHDELDAVPNFSAGQNAASLETTVQQIAQTLTERDIRVVMLSATDVFDELFLARMLGRLAPNLSVVVLDSDALFLHQGGGEDYNHVFLATPFPSLPYNLFWAAPSGRLKDPQCTPRIFPSESTQGAYLAAGSILVDGPSHPGLPFVRQQFCTTEYTSPFVATDRPPVWLVSIEHGALWPLATIPMLEDQGASNIPAIAWPQSKRYKDVTGLLRHHVPVTLWMGLFAVLLLTIAHVYGSTAVTIRSHLLWDYAISDPETRNRRLIIEFGLTLVAIVAIRFLLPPDMASLVMHSHAFSRTAIGAMVVLVLLAALQAGCLAAGTSPVSVLKGWFKKPGSWTLPVSRTAPGLALAAAAAAALSLALPAAVLPWKLLTQASDDFVDFFERYRSLYPFSGSAPTLPILLLLAALALSLVSRVGRLYFSGPWRPILPDAPPQELCLPSEQTAAPIARLLHHASGNILEGTLPLWLLVALALLLVHVSLDWAAPTTLDGNLYTLGVKCLAAAVVGSLTFDLLRAWRLWRLLRVLVLRPLERTPLRRGFDRIKGMSWHRIWRTMDSSPTFSYQPVRRALELATGKPGRLGLAAGENQATIDAWARAIQTANTYEEQAAGWGSVLHSLAALVQRLLPEMTTAWTEEIGGVTAKDDIVSEREKDLEPSMSSSDSGTAGTEKALPAQEEFAALVYLQYIRIVIIQVRHSLFTAAACYVLLAAAMTQYPIVGRHAVEISLSLLFAFLAVVAVSVYAAINRDSILSRTTSSEPGKLDLDFYIKVASYLGLPLLGLLASQFPELASTLFSYLQVGGGAGK